jgi:hypothetical protein
MGEKKIVLFYDKMLPSGAKDNLNLKENKTNTSGKKLKTLTEDSNQQPVKRKKKRRRNNKNNNCKTTKSHRDARSKHKHLTLASSHIYIQKAKAVPNLPKVVYP